MVNWLFYVSRYRSNVWFIIVCREIYYYLYVLLFTILSFFRRDTFTMLIFVISTVNLKICQLFYIFSPQGYLRSQHFSTLKSKICRTIARRKMKIVISKIGAFQTYPNLNKIWEEHLETFPCNYCTLKNYNDCL